MSTASRRGRAAKTEYRVLSSSNEMSLVECKLHSGRTHQVRVHLQHLGHPVLGDKIYGKKQAKAFPRQMLHAWKQVFQHQRTAEGKNDETRKQNDLENAITSLPPQSSLVRKA